MLHRNSPGDGPGSAATALLSRIAQHLGVIYESLGDSVDVDALALELRDVMRLQHGGRSPCYNMFYTDGVEVGKAPLRVNVCREAAANMPLMI